MIATYGWFTSEISSERPKDIICNSCSSKGQVNVERNAVLLQAFFIPLFPIRITDHFHCVRCQETISFSDMGKEQQIINRRFKSKRLPKIWHFSGVIMLIIGFLFFGYNRFKEHSVTMARLSTLSENRIIDFELENGDYSTMRVCKVNKNHSTVKVVFNTLVIESYDGIEMVISPNTYYKDTIVLDMKEILTMAENGKIKSVHW